MAQSPDVWDTAEQEAKDKGLPGHFFTTGVERSKRMAVCHACQKLNALAFCTECHCYMPIKTWVAPATCPAELWAV